MVNINIKDVTEKELHVAKQILARVIETEDFSKVQKEGHPLNGWLYTPAETNINAESMARLLNGFAKNLNIGDKIVFGKNSQGIGFVNVFGKDAESLKANANLLDDKIVIPERKLAPMVKNVIAEPVNHKPGYKDLVPKAKTVLEKTQRAAPVQKKEKLTAIKTDKTKASFTTELGASEKPEILVGRIATEALKHPAEKYEDYIYIGFKLDSSFNRKAVKDALTEVLGKFLSEGKMSYGFSAKDGGISFYAKDEASLQGVLRQYAKAYEPRRDKA